MDKVLPFGLQSASIIFSIVDALQWILEQKDGCQTCFTIWMIFITVSMPNSSESAKNLCVIKQVCAVIGTTLEAGGPSQRLPLPGIELDLK